jgi:hypothetical protein
VLVKWCVEVSQCHCAEEAVRCEKESPFEEA